MSIEENLKKVLESNTENNIILHYSIGSLTLFTSIPNDNPNCTELSKQFYEHIKWRESTR